MLCATEDRGVMRWNGICPDCNGCIDDRCKGGTGHDGGHSPNPRTVGY